MKIQLRDGSVIKVRMDRLNPHAVKVMDIGHLDKITLLCRIARREVHRLKAMLEEAE